MSVVFVLLVHLLDWIPHPGPWSGSCGTGRNAGLKRTKCVLSNSPQVLMKRCVELLEYELESLEKSSEWGLHLN